MRTHLLGLAAAALTAGTLSLGLPTSPAQAVGALDGGNISGSGDVPNSVDVAAFGAGDAIAAWARPAPGGTKVYAAIATNGVWGAAQAVTPAAGPDAHEVHTVANDAGDLAVVWNQTTGGEHKVRGARWNGDGWSGSTLLSPTTDIEVVEDMDAGIDGAGRVHVVYTATDEGTRTARSTFWTKGGTPLFGDFGTYTSLPSVAVNPAGDALVSYHVPYNDHAIMVRSRSATAGWTAPEQVSWPGAADRRSVAGIADDGSGAVQIGAHDQQKNRAIVARINTAGAISDVQALSTSGVIATDWQLAVSPNGTMQASWSIYENDADYVIRQATALPGQAFGTPSLADGATTSYQPHVGLVSDRRFQAVVHNDDDDLTVRYRTNPVLGFSQHVAAATNGAFAADMDRNGDVVAVGVVENGFSSYVEGEWLDLAGPQSSVTAPGPQVLSKAFDVTWSATDSLTGVKTRAREACP